MFNRIKVNFVIDNVIYVDYDKKVVIIEYGSYLFDYLVFGMGGEFNDFGIFGVGENGFIFWFWEDFVKLCNYIEEIVMKVFCE